MKNEYLNAPGSEGGATEWHRLNGAVGDFDAAYLLYPEVFISNFEGFLRELRGRYKNTALAYSVKTNRLPVMVRLAASLGMYVEVVSGFEYRYCRALGVPGERIIFNGPAKTHDDISQSLSEGARLHIDSIREAELVADISKSLPRPASVGIRCSLGFLYRGRPTRFGLNEQSGELERAFEILANSFNVRVSGLHCHSSYDRSADSFLLRTQELVRVWAKYFSSSLPEFIDVGGGFAGPMPESLRGQLGYCPPSYSDYAAAVGGAMARAYGVDGCVELIIEPGVGLLGNAMELVCRVSEIKDASGRGFVVVPAAVSNIKIANNEINPPTSIVRASAVSAGDGDCDKEFDIVGFTCLEHDVIYHGFVGDVSVGDIVSFGNVGAYSVSNSPDFIRPTPPVRMLDDHGSWVTVWKAASPEDLIKIHAPVPGCHGALSADNSGGALG